MTSKPLITTSHIRSIALVGLLISCLVSSLGYAVSRVTKFSRDDISQYEHRFARLKAEIPEKATIGYINDEKDSLLATKKFYVAQYVLSPRILINGTESEIVITDFYSSPSSSWKPTDFVLIKDLGEGVALYNRRTK